MDKYVYTCVTKEFLQHLTTLNGDETPKHVFICGVDTDCCVLKTDADLSEQGVMPLVLTEYCNSNGGLVSHAAVLLAMSRLIGSRSLVSEEITSADQLHRLVEERMF